MEVDLAWMSRISQLLYRFLPGTPVVSLNRGVASFSSCCRGSSVHPVGPSATYPAGPERQPGRPNDLLSSFGLWLASIRQDALLEKEQYAVARRLAKRCSAPQSKSMPPGLDCP